MVIFYVLAIPLSFILFVSGKNLSLDLWETMKRFGPLYQKYNDNARWWEAIILLRKLVLVVFSLFFTNYVVAKALGLVCLITLAFVLQRNKMPYRFRFNNFLESILLLAQLVLLLAGMLFYSNSINNAESIFLKFAVFAVVALSLLAAVVIFAIEILYVQSRKDEELTRSTMVRDGKDMYNKAVRAKKAPKEQEMKVVENKKNSKDENADEDKEDENENKNEKENEDEDQKIEKDDNENSEDDNGSGVDTDVDDKKSEEQNSDDEKQIELEPLSEIKPEPKKKKVKKSNKNKKRSNSD